MPAQAALGTVVTSLLGNLLADLGSKGVSALLDPAIKQPPMSPAGGGPGKGFMVPLTDTQSLYQWAARENYNIALQNLFRGSDNKLPRIDPELIIRASQQANLEAGRQLGERQAYLARIQGELGALPAAYQAVGTGLTALGGLGQSSSNVLENAIETVLKQDPVGTNQALANIARGF